MQNLTAEEKDLTQCGLCLHSPVYYATILPYVLISLPANGWVLWLMISSPVFWTDKMEVFDFHMVLIEMLFGFLGTPFLTMRLFFNYEVADTVTKLINIMFIVRIQFLNCVCVERYVAVLHPMLYRRYRPLRYRISLCCVLCLEALLIGLVQMFLCTEHLESLVMYRVYFFIVFILNSFCSLSVFRALKQPSPGEGGKERPNLIKKRAFNKVLIFQVNAIVGYLPMVTMFFLVYEIEWSTLCILRPLAYFVMVWHGVIHPLLYLHRARKHLVRNDVCVNCFQV